MSRIARFRNADRSYCGQCEASVEANSLTCPDCGAGLAGSHDLVADGGDDNEMLYVLGGAACLVLGFFIFPIVFAPLGTFLGYKARADYGSTAGTIVMALGILEILLMIGFVVIFILFFVLSIGASASAIAPIVGALALL